MDPSQIFTGKVHCAFGGGGVVFVLVRERLKRREESGPKNFCIPIFLTVLQPYQIPVIYFLRDFIELFLNSV